MIFIPQRWILKIYFKVDNVLLKLRAESARRFEMPKCQHCDTASLPVPAHSPRAPAPPARVQYPISALRVIDHCPSSTTALPGPGHGPCWPGPWPPVGWLASLASTASSLLSHSVVTRLSLTLVTSLGWPHFTSSAQPQMASAAQHTWTGLPSAVPACPPASVGLWEEPWLVTPCLPCWPNWGPPLATAHTAPWPGDRYGGEGRARLLSWMRSAVLGGGSSKVHQDNLQLGLNTFSSRRVVSTRALCQERLKSFIRGAFQNLTWPWTIQLWNSVCRQQKVGPDEP